MNLLLDTHTLIWFVLADPSLERNRPRPDRRPRQRDPGQPGVVLGDRHQGQQRQTGLEPTLRHFIDLCFNQYGFCGLPIEPAHTTRLATLPYPPGHKDPFDRLLIAQAIVEGIPIIGVDPMFDAYPVRRIW